jgi:ribosomal protein L7/L12
MPILPIVLLVMLSLAWYATLCVVVARRRLDRSRSNQPIPTREKLTATGASEQIARLLAEGRKIEAIKAYREEISGTGLKDAKSAIDDILQRARAADMSAPT